MVVSEIILLTLGVLSTNISMDMQVLEAMNLVVHLDIPSKVVGTCDGALLVQECNGVLWRIFIRHLRPVGILDILGIVKWLIITTSDILVDVIVNIDRTCGVYGKSSTNSSTSIRIVIPLSHVLGSNVESQVIIEEAW